MCVYFNCHIYLVPFAAPIIKSSINSFLIKTCSTFLELYCKRINEDVECDELIKKKRRQNFDRLVRVKINNLNKRRVQRPRRARPAQILTQTDHDNNNEDSSQDEIIS